MTVQSSFIGVFTGEVREVVSGEISLPGASGSLCSCLDVEVLHCQVGVCVSQTFRLVGAMADQWRTELRSGRVVTLTGTLCVDGGVGMGELGTYWLVTGVWRHAPLELGAGC